MFLLAGLFFNDSENLLRSRTCVANLFCWKTPAFIYEARAPDRILMLVAENVISLS